MPIKICNFNRHYAEFSGYWNTKTSFLKVPLYHSNRAEQNLPLHCQSPYNAYNAYNAEH